MNSSQINKIVITTPTEEDRQAIYAIRHDIYAKELGQHHQNNEGSLRDNLDDSNHYIIAKLDDAVIGFISITSPFSKKYSIDKYFNRAEIPVAFDLHLYELRILSITKNYRNGPLAYLLMYAGMRWIESHGGENIMAICRSEILDMYRKVGLKPTGLITKSGAVSYELCYAGIADFNEWLKNKKGLFEHLVKKVNWKLPFAFSAPRSCFHGGSSFKAIGENLQTIENRHLIISADVLDAWFPPSPKLVLQLQDNLGWLLQTSPPTHSDGLVKIIAEKRGVPETCILPGAGSSDLIFLALPYFLNKSSRVLILDPCYGEYSFVLDNIIQCTVVTMPLQKKDGFVVSTELLLNETLKGIDMVIIVNPNNPTGVYIDKETMKSLLEKISTNTLIWIDETYIDFVGKTESLEQFAAGRENVIICKSMSKVYALSGARVGYLCCSPYLIETLKLLTPPWAVSLPTQLAAITALQDDTYYSAMYQETISQREKLKQLLINLGITDLVDSVANFILCYLPDDVLPVSEFLARCRSHHLFLRDVSNMGTALGKNAIRIAIKDKDTNARIIAILGRVMEELKEIKELESSFN